jgi:hypothetical protein
MPCMLGEIFLVMDEAFDVRLQGSYTLWSLAVFSWLCHTRRLWARREGPRVRVRPSGYFRHSLQLPKTTLWTALLEISCAEFSIGFSDAACGDCHRASLEVLDPMAHTGDIIILGA